MKWGSAYRAQMDGVGSWLTQSFDNLWAAITGAWKVEHTDDDTHGHVHAQTLQVGRVSYSTVATIDFNAAQVNNLNDASLRDAGLMRAGSTLLSVSLTGIQVPQDELGNIIDARVLVVENTTASTVFVIEHEHTASSPANRFTIPWSPGLATGLTSQFFLMPGSLATLIYDKVKGRWMVHAQSNDQIESYNSIAASANDYSPLGSRSAGLWKIVPTVANITISGFDASTTVAPASKVIVNEGSFRFAILHMNTGSAAGNRVQCPAGSMYYVNPRESVVLYRDVNGTWIIRPKADQWVDVTYSGANFTASTGTWTVQVGDQETFQYTIDGDMMTVNFRLVTTSLSAATQRLSIPIPAGRICARTTNSTFPYIDNGVAGVGLIQIVAGNTTIDLFTSLLAPNWAIAANASTFVGQVTFMVRTDCATVAELHTDVAHADVAHGDAGHSDVAHIDTVHIDAHTDTPHADAGHGDSAHSDVAHVDTPHSDVAHADFAHGDGHTDAAHSDSHGDSHTDAHGDTHTDQPHLDFNDGFPIHDDTPFDDQHTDTHSDVAHSDTHGDGSHGDDHNDQAHQDSHSDVAHGDSHSDVAHSDSAHSDTPFSDSHTDTPHSDTAHTDSTHTDTVHSDSPHTDVGYHCDVAHTDI